MCPKVHEGEQEQATVIVVGLARHIRRSARHGLPGEFTRHARMLLEPAHRSGRMILLIQLALPLQTEV